MTRIKNTNEYPIVLPKLDDFFIGSQKSNNGKTVNFEFSDVVSIIGGGGQPNRIISGKPIWIPDTLSFYIPIITYFLNGQLLTTEPITITLDDGGLLDRKDVIAVTSSGTIYVEKGEESENPALPTLPDGINYLQLTFVDIAAGETEPTGITSTLVYGEFLGEPDEFEATSVLNTPTNIDLESTVNPRTGSKSIRAFLVEDNDYIEFTNNSLIDIISENSIQFYINLKAAIVSGSIFDISLYNGATLISNLAPIQDGSFLLDSNIINEYQVVSVDFSDFILTDTQFDTIRFTFNSGATPDYYDIDDITIVEGVEPPLFNFKHSELDLDDGTNPHGTTAEDVGLGNVDNTSDIDKPVSIAQQAAIDAVVGVENHSELNLDDGTNPHGTTAADIGVEAGADVTDATNVGDSISSAAAKTTPVDADLFPILDSAESLILKKLSWLNIKTTLKTYFDGFYVLLTNFLEEKLLGTATYNGTTTGSVNWDLNSTSAHYSILTGNTTVTFTNTPASGKSLVRTYYVKSSVNQTLTLANSDFEIEGYIADGTLNRVTVEATNFPTVGLLIVVTFENIV